MVENVEVNRKTMWNSNVVQRHGWELVVIISTVLLKSLLIKRHEIFVEGGKSVEGTKEMSEQG